MQNSGEMLSTEDYCKMCAEHGLDPQSIEIVRQWYPICHNKPSVHLDGKWVVSPSHVLMHAHGETKMQMKQQRSDNKQAVQKRREQRNKATQQKGEYVASCFAWQDECKRRREWIESLNDEWRLRIHQRNKAVAEWEAFVLEARTRYQEAKKTPAPPQPIQDA